MVSIKLNFYFNLKNLIIYRKETKHTIQYSLKSLQQFFDFISLVLTTYLCFKVDMGLGIDILYILSLLSLLFDYS